MNEVLKCYRNWTFEGRAPRRQFWLWFLFQAIVSYCVYPLSLYLLSNYSKSFQSFEVVSSVFAVFVLASLQPGLAVSVRRLHDLDTSGWWLCIVVLPLIVAFALRVLIGLDIIWLPLLGGLAFLVFMAREGTDGPNRFGPDPLAKHRGAAASLWPPPAQGGALEEDRVQPESAMVRLPDLDDSHAPANQDSPRRNASTEVVDPPADIAGEARTKLIRPSGFVAQDKKPAQVSDDPVVGWVVVVDGPGKGRWRQLGLGTNDVARSPGARVPIDFGDDLISRDRHALITFDPGANTFFVQHGGGKNLTYLGDTPVLVPQQIHSGQEITLGVTRLRFVALCGPQFHWQAS